VLLIAAAIVAPAVAQASFYEFTAFDQEGEDMPYPGLYLYMTVEDYGDGLAHFTFYNESAIDCSIARIYFDDGSLLGVDTITNGPGTEFARAYPGPDNLPGGQNLTPPFEASRGFNIGAVNPPPKNGVKNDPFGEWVDIAFTLQNGQTIFDVMDELQNGTLRVGLHVLAFPDGGSESFIDAVNEEIPIPEPSVIALLACGALGMLVRRPRRSA